MGKKNKAPSSLGRSLIKDRFGVNKGRKMVENNSMLHTTEIQDGYDWGRLNLQSVTEESSFQEFLSTAELAGTEFQGEKLNITFVNPRSKIGMLSSDDAQKMKIEHDQHKEFIKIPRRPPWTSETTAAELDQLERAQFLEWRRNLATLQENKKFILTPFEKNLEFWRQLWRVVERSDVIVQIVDARNPLLFRCEDLEIYVKEVSEDKINLILINKADHLTNLQRIYWAEYFDKINVRVAFFSALAPEDEQETDINKIREDIQKLDEAVNASSKILTSIQEGIDASLKALQITDELGKHYDMNSAELLSRERLITLFRMVHRGPKVIENVTTIGLVGYPNVGKSSTINSLLIAKKVSVSATPGKTKHFQTLYLDNDLLLCDCPGLVMPSFVFTKAEMVVSGILPIDQMRDHVPPITLVANLIPRYFIEDMYGLMLPTPEDGEEPNRPPTSEELLNSYGYIRGYMTANGQPDNPRSARYILKDFVNGKLLYCHAPPGVPQDTYHTYPEKVRSERTLPPREQRAIKSNNVSGEDLDKAFFKPNTKEVHARGVDGKAAGVPANLAEGATVGEKPWKKANKHANKMKREKLRRVYAALDQH